MDIQALINEIVAKLNELYAALGAQRVKVGKAIESLTGTPVDAGMTMTPEEVAELKKELAELKTKIRGVEPVSQ